MLRCRPSITAEVFQTIRPGPHTSHAPQPEKADAGVMTRHSVHADDFGPEGSRPARDKRRFAVAITAVVGLLVLLGGFAVSALTHQSVQWAPLLWATGFVVIGYAAFLWVRLSR